MRLWILASALLVAARALAAEVGACGTPEAITAAMKGEGQRAVAYADDVDDDKSALMFTVNADLSLGYILKSDRPASQRAQKVCVFHRMVDIRLHDARRPGVPPAALLNAPEADAHKRCAEFRRKAPEILCGSLNALLRRMDAEMGTRPMLQAIVTRKRNNAYERVGELLTLTGQFAGPAGSFRGGGFYLTALPDGATPAMTSLGEPTYTEYGLSLLR